jgi:arylsulfatase A-like enzyme
MKRPNVIVFFTDQQRHDTTGLHGCPLDLTPNLDRMARAGTHLTHSFTCQPVCGPARACLQTGRFATQTGVWRNGIGLPSEQLTLAQCFNQAGYHTSYVGKWHLARTRSPDHHVPAGERGNYQRWLASNALEHTADAYRTRLFDNEDRAIDLPGYRVDAIADEMIRQINAFSKDDKPFFLFGSFIEPHHQNHRDDYPAPTGYAERYTGRWTPPDLQALTGNAPQHLGGYFGMVRRLDEALGRLLDAVKSLGIEEETIVLFTSDHACHFKTRNAEYKRSCHDASIRVPTAMTGPGFVGGGAIPELVSLIDLPPTLLNACGIDIPPGMVGRSIVPLTRSRDPSWPDDVFIQISESAVARAVRTRRWKYCVTAVGKDGNAQPSADTFSETHLFDLEADPYELTNLVGLDAFADVRADMSRRLNSWIDRIEGHRVSILPADQSPSGQRHP